MICKITSLLLVLLFLAAVVSAQERGPSTPEERKRAVEIVSLLEKEPFRKDAPKLTSELMAFLIQVPDVGVHLCNNVLGNYEKIDKENLNLIIAHLTFAQAKFVIEHPDQADDRYQEYLGGVAGVLKAYRNIKAAKPKVRIEPLEELLVKEEAGQLGDFVKSAMANCKKD